MTKEQLLELLEPIVRQQLQGDRTDAAIIVVRAPEGLVILQRGSGGHLLLSVQDAELVVR